MVTIKPIKTEPDYDRALQEIESLFDVSFGSEEADRLEVLVTLAEAYEVKTHPVGLPNPVAAIHCEIEKRGPSRKDLKKVLGSSGRVSELLTRRRPLTVPMIKCLHQAYQISLEILLADYPLAVRVSQESLPRPLPFPQGRLPPPKRFALGVSQRKKSLP